MALELYRRHPGLVATLIMIDTYAGWKGSLPMDEVRARAAGARRMLVAPTENFDPTLPGLFGGDPPAFPPYWFGAARMFARRCGSPASSTRRSPTLSSS